MAEIIWSVSALADIQQIGGYIERDSLKYAQVVISSLVESVERLKKFPKSGRVIPELHDESLREVIAGNFRIMDRLKGQRIEIFSILHGRQDAFKKLSQQ
ncbi:MAG: type II toxin-antitoxin system RelE/ParE family toxin [Ignavibacteriales bacterium]|nr:type II toxin-antitoxin system RelE/ParE family toxin [Ignavibacteriales bacterium]